MNSANFTDDDHFFMREALSEAKKAFSKKEVPIGAVLILDRKIIARAHNLVENLKDATAHAEMVCIRSASEALENWRLSDTTLYTTLEPCCMCYGAILSSRVKRIVYGAPDIRQGVLGSWLDLSKHPHPIHTLEIQGGLYAEESSLLMKDFFKTLRVEKVLVP